MTVTKSTFNLANTPNTIRRSLITAHDNLMLCYGSADVIMEATADGSPEAMSIVARSRDCFYSAIQLAQGVGKTLTVLKKRAPEEWWTDAEWKYFEHIEKNISEMNAVLSSNNFIFNFDPSNPSTYDLLLDAFDQLVLDPFDVFNS